MGWFGDIADATGDIVKWAAPAVLAPLTGGASLAAYGAYGQSSANNTNKALAQQQMDFQERMSSTEIQRRVADLKAAGLNPMLSAINQQGASSAQGARAEVRNPLEGTASSAMAYRMQSAQLENMNAQTRLLASQKMNVDSQTNLNDWSANQVGSNISKIGAEIDNLGQQYKNLQAQYDISIADLKNKNLSNKQLEAMQPLLQRAQEIANELDRLQIPEAEVTAQWFEGFMGGGGRAANAAKDLIQIIKMLRGK